MSSFLTILSQIMLAAFNPYYHPIEAFSFGLHYEKDDKSILHKVLYLSL